MGGGDIGSIYNMTVVFSGIRAVLFLVHYTTGVTGLAPPPLPREQALNIECLI